MLTIRLQRVGKKKLPTYKLIISEKARDTQDLYLELLGTFNPHAKKNQFQPKADRITYWLSQGAQTSNTIHNLLVANGIIKDAKKKSVFLSQRRKKEIADKKKSSAPVAVKAPAEAQVEQSAVEPAAEPAATISAV